MFHSSIIPKRIIKPIKIKIKLYKKFIISKITWEHECKYSAFFYILGFTPCKAEQPLQGMELQEKKHKKITAYRKSV